MVSDVVCNSNRFNMFWCEQILFCFNVQIRFSFDQFVMELFIFSELYRIQICRYEHYFVGTNVQKLYKPSASNSEKQVEFLINSSQIIFYAFIWLHPSSLISYEAKDPFICVRLSPQTIVPCYFCGHA